MPLRFPASFCVLPDRGSSDPQRTRNDADHDAWSACSAGSVRNLFPDRIRDVRNLRRDNPAPPFSADSGHGGLGPRIFTAATSRPQRACAPGWLLAQLFHDQAAVRSGQIPRPTARTQSGCGAAGGGPEPAAVHGSVGARVWPLHPRTRDAAHASHSQRQRVVRPGRVRA